MRDAKVKFWDGGSGSESLLERINMLCRCEISSFDHYIASLLHSGFRSTRN